jgi:hypothetical protein
MSHLIDILADHASGDAPCDLARLARLANAMGDELDRIYAINEGTDAR